MRATMVRSSVTIDLMAATVLLAFFIPGCGSQPNTQNKKTPKSSNCGLTNGERIARISN